MPDAARSARPRWSDSRTGPPTLSGSGGARQATLHAFVRAHLTPGARLYTDEAATYRGLSDYRHASVRHGGSEYGRGPVHTNGIESFRALFKRGFRGTYHSMSPKHLHRYAREFEGRHNHKADGALQHMACLVQGMEGKRLTYWELTSSPSSEDLTSR